MPSGMVAAWHEFGGLGLNDCPPLSTDCVWLLGVHGVVVYDVEALHR